MSRLIAFEGPDGSGKSTQARLLGEFLRDRGYDVLETREPGGTPLGDSIRALLLEADAPPATPLAMTLLLSASRAQLVDTVIRPALEAGQTVIVDRYTDSTLAYQSYGFGVDMATVKEAVRTATGGLRPDIGVYVDIDPALGLERTRTRGPRNRFDAAGIEFHRRVRAGYLELIARDPERWICVDGSASPEEVHNAILRQLEPWLEATNKPL
jgi:dTMP kinase